jgi:hypothetical protein
MKISKARLIEIIKEELSVINEDWEGDEDDNMIEAHQRGHAVAEYYLDQRNQVDTHWRDRYDAVFNRQTNKQQSDTKELDEVRAPFPTGSRVSHEEHGEGVVTHAGTKNTNVAVKFDKETANGKKNRQVSRGSLKKAKQ